MTGRGLRETWGAKKSTNAQDAMQKRTMRMAGMRAIAGSVAKPYTSHTMWKATTKGEVKAHRVRDHGYWSKRPTPDVITTRPSGGMMANEPSRRCEKAAVLRE